MQTGIVKQPVRCILKEAKKREAEKVAKIMEMRNNLPVLTRDQIRRFRLPLHEAVMQELIEKGYPSSAEFLRQLIDLQLQIRAQNAHDTTLMARPQLLKSNKMLLKLGQQFEIAEEAHYNDNMNLEADTFLRLCYELLGMSEWIWLVDQLFSQCFIICQDVSDNNFRITCWRVIFGKFLLHTKNDLDGLDILMEAKEESENKTWTLGHITGNKFKRIVQDVCETIYNSLIKNFKTLLDEDAYRALELCCAVKEGIEGCLALAEINVMQAKCEIKLGFPENATAFYTKAYTLYKSLNMHDKACEAKFGVAFTYLRTDKWDICFRTNLFVLRYAELHNLPQYVGLAYLYIGRYNLNKGLPEKATDSLVKAYEIFHKINDFKNKDFVEDLVAISKGQQLIPELVNLIKHIEEGDKQCLLKFIDWKGNRTPFWKEEEMLSSQDVTSSATDTHFSSSSMKIYEESTTSEMFGLVSEAATELPDDNEGAG